MPINLKSLPSCKSPLRQPVTFICQTPPHVSYKVLLMRFPSFPTIARTFFTISNYTASRLPQQQFQSIGPFTRGTVLKSMPTIPFLGSFFSTSSSKNMSYPVQKSDDEWQAVLSKGKLRYRSFPRLCLGGTCADTRYRTVPYLEREGHRASRKWQIRQAHAL